MKNVCRFESMDENPPVESPVDEVDEIFRKYEEKRKQVRFFLAYSLF